MLNPQHIANAQAPLDQSTLFVRLPPLLPPTSHVFEDTWLTSCCCLVDNLQPTLTHIAWRNKFINYSSMVLFSTFFH